MMHIRNREDEKETPLSKGRNVGLLDRLLALQSRNSSPLNRPNNSLLTLTLSVLIEIHEATCNGSGVLQSSDEVWISWATPCVVVQSPGLSM